MPPFFINLYLGVLGVSFVVAQDMLGASSNLFLSSRRRQISNMLG
jgi:hypothetical protein